MCDVIVLYMTSLKSIAILLYLCILFIQLLSLAFRGSSESSWSYFVLALGVANILLAVCIDSNERPMFRLALRLSVLAMAGAMALLLLDAKFYSFCETDICTMIVYFLLAIGWASLPVAGFIELGKRFLKTAEH
jgi:hypothetical protein